MKASLFAIGLILLFCHKVSAEQSELPHTLKNGLLDYQLGRGDYLQVLNTVSPKEYDAFPFHVAIAQKQLGLSATFSVAALAEHLKQTSNPELHRMYIAEILFEQSDCKRALKYLKGKAKTLNDYQKTKRAYLRGQCFIALGKHQFAAKSLSAALSGEYAANAYYNLAAEHASSSRNPKRALISLRVARDINGNSESASELTSLINLSAGSLYLGNDKPELASQFFDQISLDSLYVSQGLYLSGIAKTSLKDFRGAVQSWKANAQYGLTAPGVSESMLALPNVQAQSGYQTQALESYMRASNALQLEREQIAKLRKAIKQYGATEVFLGDSERPELAWFLTRAGAKNTARTEYLAYVSRDDDTYYWLSEYAQLSELSQVLTQFKTQFKIVSKTLSTQRTVAKSKAIVSALEALNAALTKQQTKIEKLEQSLAPGALDKAKTVVQKLKTRLDSVAPNSTVRQERVTQQAKAIKRSVGRIAALNKRITTIKRGVDAHLSDLITKQLSTLDGNLLSFYEQSELGLIQILEAQARLRTKRTNFLDGRYQ